jgi:hypothetical protein
LEKALLKVAVEFGALVRLFIDGSENRLLHLRRLSITPRPCGQVLASTSFAA